MKPFVLQKLEEGDAERLADEFCSLHGDSPNGIIPYNEYDRIFDHTASILKKHGSFTEGSGDADFSGYRYVDQIPWIVIVPDECVSPSIALSAGLEAVSTAHRPFVLAFDYPTDELFIMPGSKVFSTFTEEVLNENGA